MGFFSVRCKKVWLAVFCLLVLFFIFFPHPVFALDLKETLATTFNLLIGVFLQFMEVIVGLFQFLFLKVIEYTILKFGESWREGFLSGFGVAWQILRDFVNLVIVVFFVLIAMMTSFGDGNFGFHRKSLLHLIGAAIFVNFSAFVTLLVIDISHIAFMLFFNALPLEGFGSLSPFSGYSKVLGKVSTPLFNIVVAVIAVVVNWFIILGLLYFCVILIERYIIAMFLVLLSPLAILGYFGGLSGGNALVKKFSDFYQKWKERLAYVFTTPVILILGFVLLITLFRSTLGSAVDPENFVQLLGVDNPQGREVLLRLILGSIVLIFGIFKVGEVAKNANILSKDGIGKFKFGETFSKLVGPKSGLGLLRSVRNPAKQTWLNKAVYDKRKKWREEGSVLANIPGIGKPLNVVEKAKRAGRAVGTVGKGFEAVATGKSARDIDWTSGQNVQEKTVWDTIHNGSNSDKENLLAQALDPKSKIELNEQQTALLARNPSFHKLISKLGKGVSRSTYREIYRKASRDGNDLANIGGSESVGKEIQSAEYDLGQKNDELETFDKQRQGVENDLKKSLETRDNLDKEIYELGKKRDENIALERESNTVEDMNHFKKEIEALENQIRDKEKALSDANTALNTNQREAEQKLDTLQKDENALVDAIEQSESHVADLKKEKDRVSQEEIEVVEIMSNLASQSSAGTNVVQDALKHFDKRGLDEAVEARKSLTGIQNDLAQMGDKVPSLQKALTAMLNEQEQDVVKDFVNSDNFTGLGGTLKSIWEDEKSDLNKKIKDFADAYAEAVKAGAQQQSGALDQAIEDLKEKASEIKSQREEANTVNKGLQNALEGDSSDSQKLDVIKQSTDFVDTFVQEGSDQLAQQMSAIQEQMEEIEKRIPDITDRNNDAAYRDLKQQKDKVSEQQKDVDVLKNVVQSAIDSDNRRREILAGDSYKQAVRRERKARMFSVDTQLKSLKKEMNDYRGWHRKRKGITKKNDKSHEKEDGWKVLDERKKKLEKIKRSGGALFELSAGDDSSSKKSSSKKKSSKKKSS